MLEVMPEQKEQLELLTEALKQFKREDGLDFSAKTDDDIIRMCFDDVTLDEIPGYAKAFRISDDAIKAFGNFVDFAYDYCQQKKAAAASALESVNSLGTEVPTPPVPEEVNAPDVNKLWEQLHSLRTEELKCLMRIVKAQVGSE